MNNGYTATENLDAIANKVETKIAYHATKRNSALEKLTVGVTTTGYYEDLIVADAAIKVYSNVRSVIKNLRETEGTDEQRLEHLMRTVLRKALETHFVNSSSNVYVEMELRERAFWTEVAADLNGF